MCPAIPFPLQNLKLNILGGGLSYKHNVRYELLSLVFYSKVGKPFSSFMSAVISTLNSRLVLGLYETHSVEETHGDLIENR